MKNNTFDVRAETERKTSEKNSKTRKVLLGTMDSCKVIFTLSFVLKQEIIRFDCIVYRCRRLELELLFYWMLSYGLFYVIIKSFLFSSCFIFFFYFCSFLILLLLVLIASIILIGIMTSFDFDFEEQQRDEQTIKINSNSNFRRQIFLIFRETQNEQHLQARTIATKWGQTNSNQIFRRFFSSFFPIYFGFLVFVCVCEHKQCLWKQ